MSDARKMFAGLAVGAAAGLAVSRAGPAVAEPLVAVARQVGMVWLHALQMTVVPLVVSLLVVGVTQAADAAATGRLTRRALAWILALSTASAALTAVVAPRLLDALPRSPGLVAEFDNAVAGPAVEPLAGGLAALVPKNVVAAAAAGAVAPLVFFTLCFSFALVTLEPARREAVVGIAQAVAEAMTVIVGWVLRCGPIGVMALILPVTVRSGAAALGVLGVYVVLLVAVYLLITALLYVVVRFASAIPVGRFAAAILPAQVVAAGTQSSLATLPAMLEAARTLGLPDRAGRLVLPLAVSLFRVTSPAQYLAVAAFIAWVRGVELAPATLAVAVVMSVAISLGSVGLPGQAVFMSTILPIVQAAGLPVEPLGLLLAVDLIPDVFATVGNVTGDLAVAGAVGRDES